MSMYNIKDTVVVRMELVLRKTLTLGGTIDCVGLFVLNVGSAVGRTVGTTVGRLVLIVGIAVGFFK